MSDYDIERVDHFANVRNDDRHQEEMVDYSFPGAM